MYDLDDVAHLHRQLVELKREIHDLEFDNKLLRSGLEQAVKLLESMLYIKSSNPILYKKKIKLFKEILKK